MVDFVKHEDSLLDELNRVNGEHREQIDYLVTVLTLARTQDLSGVHSMIDQILRELQPAKVRIST